MMFKQKDSRIEVRKYAGYDKIKKRSIVVLVGSVPLDTLEPTVELLEKLTVGERGELLLHLEIIKQSRELSIKQSSAKNILQSISLVIDSINDKTCTDRKDLDALAVAVTDLRKALGKEKRSRAKVPKAPFVSEYQDSLDLEQ